MTLQEFKGLVPQLIEHYNWGIQYLETKSYSKGKVACYRGLDNLASFGTYGSSWQEVYEKLIVALDEGPLLL